MIIRIINVIVVCLLIHGCGSGPNPKPETNGPCQQEYGQWWWTYPTAEDALYGVGIANKQSIQLARQSAAGRARDEIARQVEVKVSNVLKDFMSESGIGEGAEALEFTENVSKQVANVTMTGAIPVCYHKIGNDTYCLVEYNIAQVRAVALEEAKSAAQKEEVLYNEFKARKGFESLEKEIEKISGGKPGGRK